MPARRADASPARATYHHGDLRRALLGATEAILAEVGPEGFTLREAARRVGVDHRAAYRHFEDKEALLAAVAEEGYRELVEATERELAMIAPGDVLERLRAIGRAYTSFAAEHPGRYRVMTGPRLNESGRFPSLEAPIAAALAIVVREIDAGARAGVIDATLDTTEVALALWATMHGLASLVLSRRMRVRRDKLAGFTGRLLDKTLLGIRAPAKA